MTASSTAPQSVFALVERGSGGVKVHKGPKFFFGFWSLGLKRWGRVHPPLRGVNPTPLSPWEFGPEGGSRAEGSGWGERGAS